MPLSGTPAPTKRKKSPKIIIDLSNISQEVELDEAEATDFNLGKKIKAPKDVMLEELSLLKNKGSQMFKMRQQRVERFVYENNPEVLTESTDDLSNLVPSSLESPGKEGNGNGNGNGNGSQAEADGQIEEVNGAAPESEANGVDGVEKEAGENGEDGGEGEGEEAANGEGPAPEEEKETVEKEEEEKNSECVKMYISPWERAMNGNEELISTMKVQMPEPDVSKDPPTFKCFNRTATPFGGFEKASQLMTFQVPEIELALEEPELPLVFPRDISSRPSFNRTPIGWVSTAEHSDIIMEHLDAIPFDGETDDL